MSDTWVADFYLSRVLYDSGHEDSGPNVSQTQI